MCDACLILISIIEYFIFSMSFCEVFEKWLCQLH